MLIGWVNSFVTFIASSVVSIVISGVEVVIPVPSTTNLNVPDFRIRRPYKVISPLIVVKFPGIR